LEDPSSKKKIVSLLWEELKLLQWFINL
jgi:hypothetical protein